MADKKQPTNADLLKEFKHMSATVGTMDGRLVHVERRWRDYDIAKAAIAEYREEEKQKEKEEQQKGNTSKPNDTINEKLIKALLLVLGICSVLLTAYLGVNQ